MPSTIMFASLSVDGSLASDLPLAGSTQDFDSINAHLLSQWRPDTPETPPSPATGSGRPLIDQWVHKQQAQFQVKEAERRAEQGHEQEHKATRLPRPSTISRETKSRRGSGAFRLSLATRSSRVRLQRTSSRRTVGGGGDAAGVSQPAPLTREEFEALPHIVQRKYFSTLERLRFVQPSSTVDGTGPQHAGSVRHGLKRRRPGPDRSVSDQVSTRLRRRPLQDSHFTTPDPLWFDSLPDKIKKRQFTREEQVVLAKHLRASVILDAADEAIYKVGRRTSRKISREAELFTPTLSSRPNSMEAKESEKQPPGTVKDSAAPGSFFESFRWLEEEDDLDLRLFLDDYHSNLREDLPSVTDKPRPSFRRHLSISKIPFGRSSVSHSRPSTSARTALPSPSNPTHAPLASISTNIPHGRRKSRTLSLVGNKLPLMETAAATAIDPAAAHYQDPEARLKLRVYLASPQKFDEAIEFGFPSADALGGGQTPNKETAPKPRSRNESSDLSAALRTFLADDDDDDKMSFNSEEASMADPDSPKTPETIEQPAPRPLRLNTEPAPRPSDSYAHMPATSREMTLRMTLTRPDLRANEEQIYGWHRPGMPYAGRRSQSSPLREQLTLGPMFLGDVNSKPSLSIDHTFTAVDHWNTSADGGLVKRIWNRVRRA